MTYASPKPHPYLPDGRIIGYVPADDPHMHAARVVSETIARGCTHRVGSVLVRDGAIIARGGNNQGQAVTPLFCARKVLESKSGEGYEFCSLCAGPHSEATAVADARARGVDTRGADVYLYGHWWCCKPCWDVMLDAGIANVHLVEGATELFERPEPRRPQWQQPLTAYISCSLTHAAMERRALYEQVAHGIELSNITAYIPHKHSDPLRPETVWEPPVVYQNDRAAVQGSHLLVAFLDEPSLGVGMELQIAAYHGIPTIAVAREDARVSRMALGMPEIRALVRYHDMPDLLRQLSLALHEVLVPIYGVR